MKKYSGLFFIFLCLVIVSCNSNHNRSVSGAEILKNIEGMYVGTFTNESHNGTYERQGTSYTGNVSITKQSSGVFSIDVRCDDYGLNARIEGVKMLPEDEIVDFSKSMLDVDYNYEDVPLFWTLSGYAKEDIIGLSIVSYVYGNAYANGADVYHFTNGKKINK